MSGTPFITQRRARFHSDTNQATVSTTFTWENAEDTNITWPSNTDIRCRFVIDNTGTASRNQSWRLMYSLNGAAYSSVGGTAGTVAVIGADMTADVSPTTVSAALLAMTTGAGTATTGGYAENSSMASLTITSVQYCEMEWAIKVFSTVADGATIDLRVVDASNVAIDAYAFTPRITVGSTAQGTFQLGTQVF